MRKRLLPVLRQNSESTQLHSLTMLQPCSQAVDLKVDRHFGEGQVVRYFDREAALELYLRQSRN